MDGYASAAWLRAFIANPDHARFYDGNNDRMPAFAANEHDPAANLLTVHEIEMLVRWLRGDDQDLQLKLRLERQAGEASRSTTETVVAQPEPTPEANQEADFPGN